MQKFKKVNSPEIDLELQKEIAIRVIKETGFESKFHNFNEDSEIANFLDAHNLTNEVYISIAPKITVERKGVPLSYNKIKIDLRDLDLGDDNCDHEIIQLYWEEGGGCMDSGRPFYYRMCNKCGKSFELKKNYKMKNFVSRFFSYLFPE
jgi:hypothetical protein